MTFRRPGDYRYPSGDCETRPARSSQSPRYFPEVARGQIPAACCSAMPAYSQAMQPHSARPDSQSAGPACLFPSRIATGWPSKKALLNVQLVELAGIEPASNTHLRQLSGPKPTRPFHCRPTKAQGELVEDDKRLTHACHRVRFPGAYRPQGFAQALSLTTLTGGAPGVVCCDCANS